MNSVSRFKDLLVGIKNKEYIAEEVLFFCVLFSSLPGLFIKIGGGSAFYFSSIGQVVAVVLLVGYDIPYIVSSSLSNVLLKNRLANRIIMVFLSICLSINFFYSSFLYAKVLWHDCKQNVAQKAESVKEVGYLATINRINEITADHKSDYYIYICPSASVWTRFENQDSTLLFFPAMTGVVCIGELYFIDEQLFANNNQPSSGWFRYCPSEKDEKITMEKAYEMAKNDGKKAIIYILEDTLSVVKIV